MVNWQVVGVLGEPLLANEREWCTVVELEIFVSRSTAPAMEAAAAAAAASNQATLAAA